MPDIIKGDFSFTVEADGKIEASWNHWKQVFEKRGFKFDAKAFRGNPMLTAEEAFGAVTKGESLNVS